MYKKQVLKHFLDSDLKEIRIFSRDEKKQDDMRHELPVSYTHLDVYKRQDKAKLVDSITQLMSNQEIQKKYYEQAIVMTREHHKLQASCKTSENVVAKAIQHMK